MVTWEVIRFKGLPTLVLHSKNIFVSGRILAMDLETLKLTLGKRGEDHYIVLYDSTIGISEPYFLDKIETQPLFNFLKYVQEYKPWFLCLQVAILDANVGEVQQTFIQGYPDMSLEVVDSWLFSL